jgi:uncharacterized protein (TIGR02145 family)
MKKIKYILYISFMYLFINISGVQAQAKVGSYPTGYVHCDKDEPTLVVDVYNPKTGRTWMDRNLGALRPAKSSNDEQAYGDLYQWGRGADGHQCRNSDITTTLSSSNNPGHNRFIIVEDWRSPSNDNLWQGVKNNPCPIGYRLPTETEWKNEINSWSSKDAKGAFNSPLKLPLVGNRSWVRGSIYNVGFSGSYWSSNVSLTHAREIYFSSTGAVISGSDRADGYSVRCIKD